MIRRILNWFHKRKKDNKTVPWKINLKKSKRDFRDYRYVYPGTTPPESYSLKKYCTPIKNQLTLGSCVAFAWAAAFELLIKKLRNQEIDIGELGFYYDMRKLDGQQNTDRGTYLRNGAKVLLNDGIGLEPFCKYNVVKYREEPGWPYYFSACLNWKWMNLKKYEAVYLVDNMKAAITEGLPVVIGIEVGTPDIYNTDFIIREPTKMNGGHAVLIIGYDDERKAFEIKNSWGETWAAYGYAWLPYSYVEKHLLEAWIIR